MKICREFNFEDIPSILRCGAKDKWDEADDVQRWSVWELINDLFGANGNIPTESEINDFIWFGCDEIFYPEDDEDDEDSEDDSED